MAFTMPSPSFVGLMGKHNLSVHRLYGIFLPNFRRKRMRRFQDIFSVTPEARIIDIGGTPSIGKYGIDARLTLVNLS
jgi:hypothetical protein